VFEYGRSEAASLQIVAHQFTHDRIVVDDQNGGVVHPPDLRHVRQRRKEPDAFESFPR
jgi:hypothetical protein